MFKTTFPPAFYKELYRYVHKGYQVHLALDSTRNMLAHPSSLNFKKLKEVAALVYRFPQYAYHKRRLKKLQILEA